MKYKYLITDLDNTLWDWVDAWHHEFIYSFKKIVQISGISSNNLKSEIRKVHRSRGTAEYLYLIDELDILGADTELRRKRYQPAIRARMDARLSNNFIYPGVVDTLINLKDNGMKIVGYTETQALYTIDRINRYNLDGLLDVIYAQETHKVPVGVDEDFYLEAFQVRPTLRDTEVRQTPHGERKPNPQILKRIVYELGAQGDDCVYLGDHLHKDIRMAQDAGIRDIHAAYGHAQAREEYELLRDVTFWTDEDVEHERNLDKTDIVPSAVCKPTIRTLPNLIGFE